MKKAEDFRKAFGPATPGFESAAKETIRELRSGETRKKRHTAGEWLRWRRPVLAAAMCLVLFIGFLAVNGTLGLSGHTDKTRQGSAQYTVQPIETALAQGIEEGEGEGEGEGLAEGAGIAADKTVGQIEHTFWGFMVGWAEKDTDRMLSLCADEWKANTPDAAQVIENLAASGKPRGYEITGVSGKDGDPVRTAGVVVQREDEAGAFTYTRYEIAFREENWNGFTVYQVDPDGFTAGEPAEPVPEEDLVLLTKEGIIRTDMEIHNAGIRYDDLIPLNLSVEKQGIRVDLVSGCVKGNETYFLYKIHDVDGKYTDYDLSFSSPWSEDSTSWEMKHLYDDREANEYTRLIHMGLSDLVPKAGGSLKVGIDQISLEDGSGFIDLLPLLKEHGGTEKGTALPILERNYRNTELPKDLKVLNYKKPLDIPLYRDACLGGIGWIDGQLHVQLHNTGRDVIDLRNGRASACSMDVTCSVTGKSYEEIINDYGPLRWDGDNDGWPEWSEFVYNCQPEDAEKMELNAHITVTDRILEDDWTFEIPLDPLRIPDDGTAAVKAMAAENAEIVDAAMKEAAAADALPRKMQNDINQLILWEFFGNWAQGNLDDMVSELNFTHKLNGEASKARLKELLESGTPLNFQINGIRPEGEEKVYTCTVELASGSGESSRCERFEVRINTDFENSRFGIDLNSFNHGQPAEMDPAKETFSLSREMYINVDLDYYYPGLRENLRPIGLTCERDGIRMELISGLLKDGEEYIFYSLEDPEGKYDLGSLDVSDLSDSIGKWETCSSRPVYRDRAARKAYFMWNPHYGNRPVDLTDRSVSLRLDYLDFLQNCWVNIAELAEQYGRTTEGVPAPEEVSEWDVQRGTFVTPEGAKVLDYRNPLDIQVLPNMKITGIGWIDDRLHVQFCVKNMTRASFYFNFVQRSELSWYDADNHGSYTEVIFDIGPGDEKIKEMYFCPNIGQEQIFGPWRIEFPLSAICPETKAETETARVLSEDEIIRANLDLELPGVSDKLLPVHLVSEKQGLRVEVVSGYVSGTESCFVISVQDPEGKYTDYRTDPSFTSDISDSIRGYGFYNLYTNEAEHKTYYAFTPTIYEPVTAEDRTVNTGIDLFRLEQSESFDLVPLLRQYGKTVEGVEQPDAIRHLEGAEQKLPRDMKFLDYTRPLDLPLFGDVCLSGIGWIGDQLHVQFHNTGRTTYQKGNTVYSNLWSAGIDCSAGEPYYSVEFDTDYDDSAEWKEYIFNVKPDATDGLALNTYITVLADILDDGWTVEFPLNTICPETAEQAPQADADDAVWPVEELVEDWNVDLDEREGKLVFDVRANTKVYTQDEIGYALRDDGTAEAMPTSIYPGHREGFSIPEKVNGHVVTAIGEEALWGFDVKSITLPDTVKSIGRHAFSSCDKLETIRIPEGVTSIENSVFLDCISLKDVTIPSSVTAIGNRAFSGCLSLTGISIPSATVSLGDYAFVGCTGLTSVALPEGLNTLGCYALYRCTGLETVEVPGGVSLVGNGAFKNCTGLQTARLQEGVTFLGADAFTGCGILETIELPESLRSVGERAFMGCASLKKLALPEGLESIGRAAFADCTGLETLEIPESVTSIGENVFKGCENLTCTVTAGSYAMLYCVNNGITCIVK